MLAYTRAAFRVRILARKRFRIERGTLILITHRRETDVPVICPPLYFGARMWLHRREQMRFAARDDLFLRGFFAGFPPGLRPRLRRLLFGFGVGPALPLVGVYPITSASRMLLVELFRARPDARIEALVAPDVADALRARASARDLPAPVRAEDALRGDYADLLWHEVTRDELGEPLDDIWARRATRATADFRVLVDIVRSGGTLVVFPEGRPSLDGEIGPVQRGLDALTRRGRPRAFLPVALAYDPLVRGRTHVFVAIGPPVPAPAQGAEDAALALLRRTMPLTCGQYVANRLAAGTNPTEEGLADAVAAARAEGRPFDPELSSAAGRSGRLAEALAAARAPDAELDFLATEYRSARASDLPRASG
jgi:hypothetical protein